MKGYPVGKRVFVLNGLRVEEREVRGANRNEGWVYLRRYGTHTMPYSKDEIYASLDDAVAAASARRVEKIRWHSRTLLRLSLSTNIEVRLMKGPGTK